MKLGKRPARPGAVKLLLRRYVNLSRFPVPPAEFGHENFVRDWKMLANDQYGCCVWSGSAHQQMIWNATAGGSVTFDDKSVLSDYSAVTGFDPTDPNTDQGTDMQAASKYWKDVGILDSSGQRHKISAYLAIEPGNIELMLAAMYVFQSVATGVLIHDSAMQQFSDCEPWQIVPGARLLGGHYVPQVCRIAGMSWGVSWNKLQPAEDSWISQNNDESIVHLSEEMLSGGKTIDGFDLDQLKSDLEALSG